MSGSGVGAAPAGASGPGENAPGAVRTFAPDFLTALFRDPLEPGYADSAAQRQVTGPRTGWRRTSARVLTVTVLIIVGFLLTVAYRQTIAEQPGRHQARAGLVAQIKQREADTDRLAGRAESLRDEVARQRDAALGGSDAARLRDLEAVTGLARVRGDGVVVRVADATVEVDAVTGSDGVNLGRVLDRDLQDIANALWGAGAEAIAINGQRLTATSTIRAAGGGAILVDFRPVIGPYEVAAIGPGQMVHRFRDSAAARLLRTVAAEHGMSFGVRAVDDLTLPAASGSTLRYAQPWPTHSPMAVDESDHPASPGAGISLSPSGGGR